MRTGFDLVENANDKVDDLQQRALHIIHLLMKQAIRTSLRFVHLCGRKIVTPIDIRMALIYEAHVFLERESLGDESDESDGSDELEEFTTQFVGDNYDDRVFHAQVVGFTDNFETWHPIDPVKQFFRNTIAKL